MMTMKTATKTRRTPKTETGANDNGQNEAAKRQPTLEELSLKAYRMTYERLYGKRKPQTATKTRSAAKLPKAA